MQRRDFFTNLTTPFQKTDDKKIVIRPPYYHEETNFQACSTCEGSCAKACEESIIVIEQDKTPRIDFALGGCTFCDACALACNDGVLRLEDKRQSIDVTIEIDKLRCMSWSKNICFSCKDPCLDDAIAFSGMFYPEIIADKCTACGFCIKYCPTEAIIIKEKRKEADA